MWRVFPDRITFCELNMQNFKPFWAQFTEMYYLVVARGSPSFHKRICRPIWWNHKCTISVPFLSKCIRMWLQGGGAPMLKKILYFASQIPIISGPFGSKFTEIYNFWWLQGGSPAFHKRMCISGNHKCTISVRDLARI